jgi:hypothetical protein
VGARPTRRPLQPEATGAGMDFSIGFRQRRVERYADGRRRPLRKTRRAAHHFAHDGDDARLHERDLGWSLRAPFDNPHRLSRIGRRLDRPSGSTARTGISTTRASTKSTTDGAWRAFGSRKSKGCSYRGSRRAGPGSGRVCTGSVSAYNREPRDQRPQSGSPSSAAQPHGCRVVRRRKFGSMEYRFTSGLPRLKGHRCGRLLHTSQRTILRLVVRW